MVDDFLQAIDELSDLLGRYSSVIVFGTCKIGFQARIGAGVIPIAKASLSRHNRRFEVSKAVSLFRCLWGSARGPPSVRG